MAWLALAATPSTAVAAGFYIGDVGARGMARGGAFVASPDSLLAANYNPAGLAQLRGFHFEASLAAVQFNAELQRACPCLDPETDARLSTFFDPEQSNSTLAIPYVAVGYGFEWLNTHVALAAWGPNSGRHNWGPIPDTASPLTDPLYERQVLTQSHRYTAYDVDNFEANATLSVAMEPLPGLRVGLTGFLHFTGSDQSLAVWTNGRTVGGRIAEDPRFDVPIEVRLPPVPGFGWGAGASYDIIEGLTIGTSFRAKRAVKGTGELTAQIPRTLVGNARVVGDEVEVELDIAPIWRAGLEYRWPSILTVEAAVVWEGWSVHDVIIARPQNVRVVPFDGLEPILIPEIPLPRDWVDTWSFRLGGELHVLEPYVDLRYGYFYETSAVPSRTVSAARIDRPKHGVSLGAAVTWKGITLELAASYTYLLPLTIRDSDIRVTGVFDTEGADAPGTSEFLSVVGNGDVSGHYLIGAVGISFALDDFLADDEQ